MEMQLISPFVAKSLPGMLGIIALWIGIIGAILCIFGYGWNLRSPDNRTARNTGRVGYIISALGVLAAFGILAGLVYSRQYRYDYVFSHTSNDLTGWFRFAAAWAGQEGSFLLWAAWTAVIGFQIMFKARRYEPLVMLIYVTVPAFLCAILLKQSPYLLNPPLPEGMLAANPGMSPFPINGRGLNPSLVNYWMTIHPPTIFFGFASLAAPFAYAAAALIKKDYEGWLPRVMPYTLLTCAALGVGLFMGGYWAYETLGWHGFWAWDPVENASFFPWLAITALAHGAIVQRDRGGMKPTNLFLGLFGFILFLLGTFLTRSGALASKGADGQLLSVHAFDNISKDGKLFMVAMLAVYGLGGLLLWLIRAPRIPRQKTAGDSILSRDFALLMAMGTMLAACVIVTLGTTQPLLQGWLHQAPSAPRPAFYNKTMLPLAIFAAFLLGTVPWLAWRKTDTDAFLKKLLIPWVGMLIFATLMFFWVLGAERSLALSTDMNSVEAQETLRAWISLPIQRVSVIMLSGLGLLALLSNAILAYRVFRVKPLVAGGWLAHVGIGVMLIGIIISNTYERTERFELKQGNPPIEKYGYRFDFEKMTGMPKDAWPMNPDYDRHNTVQIRVTPPESETSSSTGEKTFVVNPRWFVYNYDTAQTLQDMQRMAWPAIQKSLGHDLYISFASEPQLALSRLELKPNEPRQIGDYSIYYMEPIMQPGKFMAVRLFLKAANGEIYTATPGKVISDGMRDVDLNFRLVDREHGTVTPKLLRLEDDAPAGAMMQRLDAGSKTATVLLLLPGVPGQWSVPLEVTYKPWINLVWTGVIIAALGILLAMLRRVMEARALVSEENGPVIPDGSRSKKRRKPESTGSSLPAMPIKSERAAGK